MLFHPFKAGKGDSKSHRRAHPYAEAIKYMEEKQFGAGSMEPKVMAAIKFARRFPGKKAIITSLAKAKDALENGAGTVITMA